MRSTRSLSGRLSALLAAAAETVALSSLRRHLGLGGDAGGGGGGGGSQSPGSPGGSGATATRARMSSFEAHPLPAEIQRVAATGGGAHRLMPSMRSLFNLELIPVQEMEAVIGGLLVLHALQPKGELYTMMEPPQSPQSPYAAATATNHPGADKLVIPDDHLLPASATETAAAAARASLAAAHASSTTARAPTPHPPTTTSASASASASVSASASAGASAASAVSLMPADPVEIPREWPTPLFPFLLVNIGSGVSVLKVEGVTQGADGTPKIRYRRVGGTACGGATFLGLAKLLTNQPELSFSEALNLASAGDSSKVDKVVGDIYGEAGSKALGLPASLTAASFGKLVTPPPPELRYEGGAASAAGSASFQQPRRDSPKGERRGFSRGRGSSSGASRPPPPPMVSVPGLAMAASAPAPDAADASARLAAGGTAQAIGGATVSPHRSASAPAAIGRGHQPDRHIRHRVRLAAVGRGCDGGAAGPCRAGVGRARQGALDVPRGRHPDAQPRLLLGWFRLGQPARTLRARAVAARARVRGALLPPFGFPWRHRCARSLVAGRP